MAVLRGRVHRLRASVYEVHTPQGVYGCVFRKKLKRHKQPTLRLAAVGDEVEMTAASESEGVIERMLPRRSKLSRHDVHRPRVEQIIAANVDALVAVQSAAQPPLDLLTLDRCTVMAMAQDLMIWVCMTKRDLAPDDIHARLASYSAAGFKVCMTSSVTGEGLDMARRYLRGRISVLIGSSGVGKSSLLNALNPDLRLKVGEISRKTQAGRHTTSWIELADLGDGTLVADTPGLEIFSLWGVTVENIRGFFPEFQEVAPGCSYSNCAHAEEIGCAVKKALATGGIASSRYQNYLAIRRTLIQKRRTLGL